MCKITKNTYFWVCCQGESDGYFSLPLHRLSETAASRETFRGHGFKGNITQLSQVREVKEVKEVKEVEGRMFEP